MIKNLKKYFFKHLPLFLKMILVRKFVSLPNADRLPLGLRILVADSPDHLRQAFSLVYRNYFKVGFVEERDNQLHFIPQHLLPTTTVIVALDGDKVVGTLSLIRKNPLGFPCEKAFTFNAEGQVYHHYAEISCLAIDEKYRRSGGSEILFPLLKFMYAYSRDFFSVKTLFVVIHPKDIFFYQGLLFFVPSKFGVVDYMNAPAVLMELDIETAYFQFKKYYSSAPMNRNLFSFFTIQKLKQLEFPKRNRVLGVDPWMLGSRFSGLFKELVLVMIDQSKIDQRQKNNLEKIKNFYRWTPKEEEFSHISATKPFYRKNYRFNFVGPAECSLDGNKIGKVTIVDLSLTGFRAYFNEKINKSISNRIIDVEFFISKRKFTLKCEVSWTNHAYFGVQILERDPVFELFVDYLNRYYFKKNEDEIVDLGELLLKMA